MRELSLNILDITQNSISAKATVISIDIIEDIHADKMTIKITDNGCGMLAEMVQKITDPFYTTRTTRKLGFGLPFIKDTAELSGGRLFIESEPGVGTTIVVTMQHGHINRPPLGSMAETLQILIMSNPDIQFKYFHQVNSLSYRFDSRTFPDLFTVTGDLDFMRLQQLKLTLEKAINNLHQTGL